MAILLFVAATDAGEPNVRPRRRGAAASPRDQPDLPPPRRRDDRDRARGLGHVAGKQQGVPVNE